MIVSRCDLCSQAKECLQKEIDGKAYDNLFPVLERASRKAERERQGEQESRDCAPTAAESERTGRRRAQADARRAAQNLGCSGEAKLDRRSRDRHYIYLLNLSRQAG